MHEVGVLLTIDADLEVEDGALAPTLMPSKSNSIHIGKPRQALVYLVVAVWVRGRVWPKPGPNGKDFMIYSFPISTSFLTRHQSRCLPDRCLVI